MQNHCYRKIRNYKMNRVSYWSQLVTPSSREGITLQHPMANGQFSFAQLTLSDKELSDQYPDIGSKA